MDRCGRKFLVILGFLFLLGNAASAQDNEASDLFESIWMNDSLLFNVGFNQCDISQFEKLVSEDCEFYHDRSGFVKSKSDFISSIRDGLCKMDYRATRRMQKESMEVFPLKNNGVLYGAVQNGTHRFYAVEEDKEEYFTSIAKFTHLWILEDNAWRLQKIISYDHQTTDSE